jgi:enoyl-CoA hydratase/carnithine racemase
MASQSDTVLRTSTPEGITTITINRPYRRNAVDPETGQRLHEAVLAFEDDSTQKVCVLTGSEGAFCAGADLHEISRRSKSKPDDSSYLQPVQGRNRAPMGPSRLQVKKPIIAAVAGHAVAGGLELSLIADIRVVEEDAIFGVFCRRWGVPLIDGGTVRLQAIVGLGRALDMILTGRPVGAQEALSMGLANRVVPQGKALEEATKIAKQLIAFPKLCMNLDRDSCYYAAYNATSFNDAMRNEFAKGVVAVEAESIQGAGKFSSGAGRGGSFKEFSKL